MIVTTRMFLRQGVLMLACLFLCSFGGPVWAVAPTTGVDPKPFQAGVEAYRKQQFAEAVQYFQQALAREPGNGNIRYYMAITLDRLNRTPEAILQYQSVVEKGSADPKAVNYARTRLEALQPTSRYLALTQPVLKNTVTKTASQVRVPLKENKNALMVDVNVHNDMGNRQVNGAFIIDTGATYTSISQELAESLGLDLAHAEKIAITTANGRIEVPKVTIDRLNVNGLEAYNVQATVIQIRPGSSFSGLLGLSFLRQFVLTIDPDANQLIFQQD